MYPFFFDELLLLKSISIFIYKTVLPRCSPTFLPKSSGERALTFCSLLLGYEEVWLRCHYEIHYCLYTSLKIQNSTQDKILDSGDTKNVNVSILIKHLSKAWWEGTRPWHSHTGEEEPDEEEGCWQSKSPKQLGAGWEPLDAKRRQKAATSTFQ